MNLTFFHDVKKFTRSVKILTLLAFFLCSTEGYGSDVARLESLINASLPKNAQWSYSAVNMATGETMSSIGNAKGSSLAPASLMKLLISAIALENASQLHRDTIIASDGEVSQGILKGDLYIIGKGNPYLASGDLTTVFKGLTSFGIHEISGDIIADDSLFDSKGIERTRYGPAYAIPDALGLDLHTVSVNVYPTKSGKPPIVEIDPPQKDIKIALSARTVSSSQITLQIRQLDDFSYQISGNIPENSPLSHKRFPLGYPSLYAAGSLYTFLNNGGIKIKGDFKKGIAPEKAKALVSLPAPSIPETIDAMNKNSINVVADNLLLTIGAHKFGKPGTREKGVSAIRDFLQQMYMDLTGVHIVDGSGLSKENRLTSEFVARFLFKVSGKEWFEALYKSLSVPGEGTLSHIGYKNNGFRVKTGQLEDAFALAGYYKNNQGIGIAFAYIVNTPGADAPSVQKTGLEILKYIAGDTV